jgi:hypothetical protein
MKYLIHFLLGLLAGLIISGSAYIRAFNKIVDHYSIAKEAVEECKQDAPGGANCKIIVVYVSRLPKSKYEDF